MAQAQGYPNDRIKVIDVFFGPGSSTVSRIKWMNTEEYRAVNWAMINDIDLITAVMEQIGWDYDAHYLGGRPCDSKHEKEYQWQIACFTRRPLVVCVYETVYQVMVDELTVTHTYDSENEMFSDDSGGVYSDHELLFFTTAEQRQWEFSSDYLAISVYQQRGGLHADWVEDVMCKGLSHAVALYRTLSFYKHASRILGGWMNAAGKCLEPGVIQMILEKV